MGARQPTFKSYVIRLKFLTRELPSRRRLATQSDLSSHGPHPKRRGRRTPVSLLVPRVAPPVGWERQASMKRSVYSAAASVGGRTDTNKRPLGLVRKSTRPVISANKVHSFAHPTLAPGCHLVPRWRAMMLPASACSPPKIFR